MIRPTLAACLLFAGCSLEVNPSTDPARLSVTTEPENARVYVNERFIGTGRVLSQRPFDTLPGTHYVTISADGYFPHDLAIDLPRGATSVRVALRRIPE